MNPRNRAAQRCGSRSRKFLTCLRLLAIRGACILCAVATPGWTANVLTGNWKPAAAPQDDRTRRLVRISLTPAGEKGGFRYAEAGRTVVEGNPGQVYPAPDGEPLAYELAAASNAEIGIRTLKEGRPVEWKAMRVAEDGRTLLVSISSLDQAGRESQEGLYYQRVPESDCGIHWEIKPASSLYGCWLWLDGQRMLDRQPPPITIEEKDGGYRLISATQTIVLRKGGAGTVLAEGAASKSPVSRWKTVRQGIEISVIPANDKAAGTMRLELTGANMLSIRVVNTNGSESTYTYRRQ